MFHHNLDPDFRAKAPRDPRRKPVTLTAAQERDLFGDQADEDSPIGFFAGLFASLTAAAIFWTALGLLAYDLWMAP